MGKRRMGAKRALKGAALEQRYELRLIGYGDGAA